MPLVIMLAIRVTRALGTTIRLLLDVKLLRSLPWAYIRRLPLRNAWIGIVTVTLLVSTVAAIAAIAIPGGTGGTSEALATTAFWTALAGLASSWARALHQRRRLRR